MKERVVLLCVEEELVNVLNWAVEHNGFIVRFLLHKRIQAALNHQSCTLDLIIIS